MLCLRLRRHSITGVIDTPVIMTVSGRHYSLCHITLSATVTAALAINLSLKLIMISRFFLLFRAVLHVGSCPVFATTVSTVYARVALYVINSVPQGSIYI